MSKMITGDVQQFLDTLADADQRQQLLNLLEKAAGQQKIRAKEKSTVAESLIVQVKQELARRRLEEVITALQGLRREKDPSVWAKTIADARDALAALETQYPYPYPEAKSFIHKAMMAPKPESTRVTVKAFERAMGLRD